jgi:hypothetical protein|tara:strand:+ start:445 stop:636 length:192 start_codon:yes stop_codon:yes gene_type:complete
MGKMKELYMAMAEAEWEGTPNEFLTWWIHNEAKKIDKLNENYNNNNSVNTIGDVSTETKQKSK